MNPPIRPSWLDDKAEARLSKDLIALREACHLYHEKHSRGFGGGAFCVCGAGSGGSSACAGLSMVIAALERNDPYLTQEVLRTLNP